jgi:hypothetical protein
MFAKCLKHEMKATARVLLPLIVCMIVISIAAAASLGGMLNVMFETGFDQGELPENGAITLQPMPEQSAAYNVLSVVTAVLFMAFAVVMIVSVISCFVLVVRRFYTSFFTDEGYLTFTLPVTMDCHILTKTVSMLIWNFASYIAMLISIGILILGLYISVPEFFSMDAYTKQYLEQIFKQFGDVFGGTIAFGIIQTIVSTIASSLLLFFSISVGCMLAKKHRFIVCAASYFIISAVISEVTAIVTELVAMQFYNIESTAENANLLAMTIVLVSTVLYIAQGVGCYFGTRWILKNKINLD